MEKLRLALDEGERLLDALLESGIALAHECGGTLACASCRVVVLEGVARRVRFENPNARQTCRCRENFST